MWIARNYALYLFSVVISCGGLPTNYEYNYAPGHNYGTKDYSFSYGVKDLHTGDIKHQWEKKTGDVVRGRYSLVEADGSMRIVDYTADGEHGFNAVVKHKGISYHPVSKKPTSFSELAVQNKEKLTQIADYLKEASDHEGTHAESHEHVNNHAYLAIEEHTDKPREELQYEHAQYKENTNDEVYTYVPQEDGDSSESVVQQNHKPVHTDIKTKYNSEPSTKTTLTYAIPYDSKENLKQEHHQYYEYVPQKTGKRPTYIQTYKQSSTSDTNFKPLPIDLSLIKPSLKSKNVQVEVDLLNPVEIDLSHSSAKNEPKQQFAPPPIENGFKPVHSKYSQQINEIVPNTYLSNIKPVTTPGLRNYASNNYSPDNSGTKRPIYRAPVKSGPIQFPRHSDHNPQNKDKHTRPQVTHNRRVKLAKFVTYYA